MLAVAAAREDRRSAAALGCETRKVLASNLNVETRAVGSHRLRKAVALIQNRRSRWRVFTLRRIVCISPRAAKIAL
jgi:hypothetical protein